MEKSLPTMRIRGMNRIMTRMGRAFCIALITATRLAAATVDLEYAPAPVDNPLKGFVPYAGATAISRTVSSSTTCRWRR